MSPTRPSCDAPTSNAREPVFPTTASPVFNSILPDDSAAAPLPMFTLPESVPLPVKISIFPLEKVSLPPDITDTLPPVSTALPLATRTSPPVADGPAPIELPAMTLTFPPLAVLESPALMLMTGFDIDV